MATEKKTLIFLHGGPGFKDYLHHYFSALSEKFNCVFYDQMRGHTVTIQNLLDQLDEVVNVAKLNVSDSTTTEKPNTPDSAAIILVGHSWGGVLAVEYAALHPSKLSGLILMNTCMNRKQWFDDYHEEIKNLDLEDASMEAIFLTPEELTAGTPFLANVNVTFNQETFDHLNFSYIRQFDVTGLLAQIRMPILNIFGEKDIRVPARVTKTFRQYNPTIQDFEIAGAGHFSFLLEQPRQKIFELIETNFS